jgi:predicted oxidoreductase
MELEEILKLAADSGIDCDDEGDIFGSTNGSLLAFANAIAAHEREESATICDNRGCDCGELIRELRNK